MSGLPGWALGADAGLPGWALGAGAGCCVGAELPAAVCSCIILISMAAWSDAQSCLCRAAAIGEAVLQHEGL